jgi:hypothetical protein
MSTADPGNAAAAVTSDNTGGAIDSCNIGAGSVILHGVAVALDADVGHAFIVDCCRHTEGLLGDEDIKVKWALSDEHWIGLANNAPLLRAVRAERDRRIATGEAAREAAQQHFAKAPNVLGDILADDMVSPRHRIEAAKELRQAAGNGVDAVPGIHEKFVIRINLGADETLVYEGRTPCKPSLDEEDLS